MSRIKKILFISNGYSPTVGGVEKHMQNVISELPNSYIVSVLTADQTGGLKRSEIINGVQVYRFTYPKIKFLGLFLIWVKLLKYIRLILNSDIIHIHDVFIWYLPFRLFFVYKKVYITFHGWEGRLPISLSSWLQKQLAWRLTRGSVGVGKYIEKLYSIKLTYVTYGGVSDFSKKKKGSINNNIVFLGRLSYDTGVQIFLDSLSDYLPSNNIVFCGDGPLRKICSKYGVVTGLVGNVEEHLLNSKLTIASGYLSVLESLIAQRPTTVICQNEIRKKIFKCTPFYKWIYCCDNKQQLTKVLRNLNTGEIQLSRDASVWVKKHTWLNVSKLYIRLWNSY